MITRRTKIQLIVFAFITLLGCTFVGAKYARLDRFFYDSAYTVTGHFAQSGGIYAGAEVSYRGVQVGQVEKLVATRDGVDVVMSIDKGHDTIPADTLAVVANRSALGEQYVDLQPRVDGRPFLHDGSQVVEADTRTPIATATLLADVTRTVGGVDQDALKTTVSELGLAFKDTGDDLGQLIDTSDRFLQTATDNFDVTTALIRDGRTVLDGQLASADAIRGFARDLSLFSTTVRGSDKDIRTLIDRGIVTAQTLKEFLHHYGVDLSELINNLVTTGEVVTAHLRGVQTLLVAYPHVIEGGFTVIAKDPGAGGYAAHFGLVFTLKPPVCHHGYESTDRRGALDGSNRPMVMDAHCSEPATKSDPRGAQNAPRDRVAPATDGSPVVATYDMSTGKVTWTDDAPAEAPFVPAPAGLGDDSWKWLYLQPLGQ
ncbi:MCE family protein [Nocardioides jiangxiensis]|uniref:MlaD family protein n=1 Tax=Nocardioides jiangxiensis TaxID=3064524 RepID=A0ABT9AZC3_9ACTN|nr:MlaD family protein [Nocardioides sp. WY-20]MDO7867728.1 MlaD family protein [Nocardioides sp. WY-20]